MFRVICILIFIVSFFLHIPQIVFASTDIHAISQPSFFKENPRAVTASSAVIAAVGDLARHKGIQRAIRSGRDRFSAWTMRTAKALVSRRSGEGFELVLKDIQPLSMEGGFSIDLGLNGKSMRLAYTPENKLPANLVSLQAVPLGDGALHVIDASHVVISEGDTVSVPDVLRASGFEQVTIRENRVTVKKGHEVIVRLRGSQLFERLIDLNDKSQVLQGGDQLMIIPNNGSILPVLGPLPSKLPPKHRKSLPTALAVDVKSGDGVSDSVTAGLSTGGVDKRENRSGDGLQVRTIDDLPAGATKALIRINWDLDRKTMAPTKILQTVDLLTFLIERGYAEIHLVTHFSRPETPEDRQNLLISKVLEVAHRVLDEKAIGFRIEELPKDLAMAQRKIVELRTAYGRRPLVTMFQNIRFYDEERHKDPDVRMQFGKRFKEVTGAEVYIIEALESLYNKRDASTMEFAQAFPLENRAMGPFAAQEIQKILDFLSQSERGRRIYIFGGKKWNKPVQALELMTGGRLRRHDWIAQVGAQQYLTQKALGAVQGRNISLGRSIIPKPSEIERYGLEAAIQGLVEWNQTHPNQLIVPADHITNDGRSVYFWDLKDHETSVGIGEEGLKNLLEHISQIQQEGTGGIAWNGVTGDIRSPYSRRMTKELLLKIEEAAEQGIAILLGGGDTYEEVQQILDSDLGSRALHPNVIRTTAGGTTSAIYAHGPENLVPIANVLQVPSGDGVEPGHISQASGEVTWNRDSNGRWFRDERSGLWLNRDPYQPFEDEALGQMTRDAHKLLRRFGVADSPLIEIPPLSFLVSRLHGRPITVYVKYEPALSFGSFKARMAAAIYHEFLNGKEDFRPSLKGAAAVTTGNHGTETIAALLRLDLLFGHQTLKSLIAFPEGGNGLKRRLLEILGASILKVKDYEEGEALIKEKAEEALLLVTHADPWGIAGYRTARVEIMQQLMDRGVDLSDGTTLLVLPVGSGGNGAANSGSISLDDSIKTLLVQSPGVEELFYAATHEGQIRKPEFNERAQWELDGITATVEPEALKRIMARAHGIALTHYTGARLAKYLFDQLGILTEPAGALGLAYLLDPSSKIAMGQLGEGINRVILPITGRATDPDLYNEVNSVRL